MFRFPKSYGVRLAAVGLGLSAVLLAAGCSINGSATLQPLDREQGQGEARLVVSAAVNMDRESFRAAGTFTEKDGPSYRFKANSRAIKDTDGALLATVVSQPVVAIEGATCAFFGGEYTSLSKDPAQKGTGTVNGLVVDAPGRGQFAFLIPIDGPYAADIYAGEVVKGKLLIRGEGVPFELCSVLLGIIFNPAP
jgi:hypothetical protein